MDPEPRPSRLRGESVKAKIYTILKKKQKKTTIVLNRIQH